MENSLIEKKSLQKVIDKKTSIQNFTKDDAIRDMRELLQKQELQDII